jgi:hypothetical protein
LFDRLRHDGLAAVDSIVQEAEYESLFLELKLSANGGEGPRLHPKDRESLGRAVSGFGNSEGGVLLWGVATDARKGADRAVRQDPFPDPRAFAARLDSVLSGVTLPAHPGVESIAIPDTGVGPGYVATLVLPGLGGPYQVLGMEGGGSFLVRVGSSFAPAPYGVLAGLFGRRPRPSLYHTWASEPLIRRASEGSIEALFALVLNNRGQGIARDVHFSFEGSLPGRKCSFKPRGNTTAFLLQDVLKLHVMACSTTDFRLPPEGRIRAVDFNVVLREPIEAPWRFRLTYGAEGAPTERLEVHRSAADMRTLLKTLLGGGDCRQFGQLFGGMEYGGQA